MSCSISARCCTASVWPHSFWKASGTDSRVAALVYIAALAPDESETSQVQLAKYPTTDVFSQIEVADGRIWLKPDGTKFYLVGPNQIQSVDSAFSTAPRIINGLAGPPTAATITPDGKTLLVGAADSNGNGFLYLVDTSSDLVTGNGGIPLPSAPTFGPYSFALISV